MLIEQQALLLDMNGTFMFGEDRFDDSQNYAIHYKKLGGMLSETVLNEIISSSYSFLDERYTKIQYRHCFPSVKSAVNLVTENELDEQEVDRIVDTFAFHELGHIPEEYAHALQSLRQRILLALVIDIWSPKNLWLEAFKSSGINSLFSAASFSSDHGIVKPSPRPFELVVEKLKLAKENCLVIGDSVRRDFDGANAAGIDCVLVGGARHANAKACFSNLLEFTDYIERNEL